MITIKGKSFEIFRTFMDNRDIVESVQKCYAAAETSVINPAWKDSVMYFFGQPFNQFIFVAVVYLISLVVTRITGIALSFTLNIIFFSCLTLFLFYIHFTLKKAWTFYINKIKNKLDISHKLAFETYTKEKNGMFVALSSDNEVVSMAAVLIDDEKYIYKENWIQIDKDDALLTRVSTLPEYQKRGLGKSVVLACIDFAKKNNVKTLKLYTSNKQKAGIKMYKSIGFKTISTKMIDKRFNLYLLHMELNIY